MKKALKNIAAIFFGLFIGFLIAEIVLHIYNPFKSRIKDGRIVLPMNVKYEYNNQSIPGLESHIVHQKNAYGFRGPLLPADSAFKIFCVGGSTTECFYLSDGKDWPALLYGKLKKNHPKIWLNNAGLDGHSTWGHLVLLRDHLMKYKPNMILFLVGCNDMASTGLNQFERYHIPRKFRILENSEIFNILQNYRRMQATRKWGMGHYQISFPTAPSADTTDWNSGKSKWFVNLNKGLMQYQNHLLELGKICEENHCIPVFLTQPTILGNASDPVTKRFLGNLEFQGESGMHYSFVLDKYNVVLQQVCKSKNWHCIDAASALQRSSDNYYDFFHYTMHGAEKMAALVASEIEKEQMIP
ncbi:MAG: SGNH/GDSL hydrolase family protein [Bacteroidetes bacterium]|nr:SGNH/GDSL hydrolase family protein [Bacteroidota bacterium]